jgi:hypothetical protein
VAKLGDRLVHVYADLVSSRGQDNADRVCKCLNNGKRLVTKSSPEKTKHSCGVAGAPYAAGGFAFMAHPCTSRLLGTAAALSLASPQLHLCFHVLVRHSHFHNAARPAVLF